jgi:hypothetical protein
MLVRIKRDHRSYDGHYRRYEEVASSTVMILLSMAMVLGLAAQGVDVGVSKMFRAHPTQRGRG